MIFFMSIRDEPTKQEMQVCISSLIISMAILFDAIGIAGFRIPFVGGFAFDLLLYLTVVRSESDVKHTNLPVNSLRRLIKLEELVALIMLNKNWSRGCMQCKFLESDSIDIIAAPDYRKTIACRYAWLRGVQRAMGAGSWLRVTTWMRRCRVIALWGARSQFSWGSRTQAESGALTRLRRYLGARLRGLPSKVINGALDAKLD